ncbi:MAG: SCO1664 family protein [Actinobacteria bacterium]|nr:SCO1664 family protein [Actinomycetota bacterium]
MTGPLAREPERRVLDPHVDAPTVSLELLRTGTLTVRGRLTNASNATLYCEASTASLSAACVYKPVRGERPLWDFPDGTLAEREVAAYLVSETIGWNVVPPTVLREGPFGVGMVQLWIEGAEEEDVVALVRSGSAPLRRMAVFDAVINNADRKGGHLIPAPGGHVFGVDHGVAFHTQDKLRTVLWGWAGQPLTEEAARALELLREALRAELGDRLGEMLTTSEVSATTHRVERLLRTGRHPEPSGDWPPVPWPPF